MAEALNIQRNMQGTWTHGRCLDSEYMGRNHPEAQGAMPVAEFNHAPGGTRALKIRWRKGPATDHRAAFLPPTTSIDSY
eukprot:CAMPEP_0173385028 /NCGR_PEP_ID=MMETSP1356-20130122/7614_1 /TAXON_ID=77927 ORGANISM="Hemiselmis virescens, Strain PCC157" /NCGR_SAMPLE_ID=MMETSP1356 /ASSEMBLY_ACC=CAM_ASM_000847 /LENGTH=78 /DNA_ID=CAMNT_0014340653 /DNA_START=79 /DNA_END=315 /DNA_ORIENTATION=+